ncbi:MAG: WYL domain-containing protein [Prochloraceae cyanobacterium]|nr:WYL domain-containing protein [Prochloraceae cyanobacterium]
MNRKKATITLTLPPGGKEKLEEIARRLNVFWGKSPSPSGLLRAIVENRLEVREPLIFNNTQVKALRAGIAALVDSGQIEEAKTLISLLLELGNLEAPIRQALLKQVGQPMEAWRIIADQHIKDRQPFHLLYKNSQSQELGFDAYYAEIKFYEKRFYLFIWCEQTEDIQEPERTDFPELIHIRCLRFERIISLVPIEGTWRNGLDYIEVQLQFYGGLVKAYEPKEDDLSDVTLDKVRTVTRKVVSPFWLTREVLRYGSNCCLIEPLSLKNRIKQEIVKISQLYDKQAKK